MPESVHVRPAALTLQQAVDALENHLIDKLSKLDYDWATKARERLEDELLVIDSYYEDLLKEQDEEKKRSSRSNIRTAGPKCNGSTSRK